MNKILVSRDGITGIRVLDNYVKLTDGEYLLEYMDDGDYEINFIINGCVKLIECSFDREVNITNTYDINKGSLNIVKFYNNLSVNEVDNINLCKKSTIVNYNFSNICRGVEKYVINVNHNSKDTSSNINNKSIALLNSDINFIINSNVLKECNNSILDQTTRIVTMGDCNTSVSPNMFIDLDDVEAKHGSVIGSFKEEDIFYLMSKGINYNDTLKLLIKGYLLGNFLGNIELRFRIMEIIDTYWR